MRSLADGGEPSNMSFARSSTTRKTSTGEAVLSQEQFTSLLSEHSASLRAYILAMVGNRTDADDVYQATTLQLWQQRDRFEIDTNFGAWAAKVAYYNVLTFRKRRLRERRKLTFSSDFVDMVGARSEAFWQPIDARRQALEQCLEQLDPRQRQLLHLRYTQSASVDRIATVLDRSVRAVYKALSRVRIALSHCIERRLRQEASQ